MPRPLQGVAVGIAITCVLLVALPVAMIIDRTGTYEAIRADQPNLAPADLDYAFYAVVAFAVTLHTLAVVLTVWLGLKAINGRGWARIAMTITLAAVTVGSVFSALAVPSYLWVVVASNVVHIIMIVLLWAPRSVRELFAAHRAAAATS